MLSMSDYPRSFPRVLHFILERLYAFSLHPSSHSVGIGPNSQDVPAYNFPSILLANALLQHFSYEIRELGHILKALWCAFNAIKIGANAYMIITNHVSNVFDMLYHLLQSRGLGHELRQTRGAVRSTTADEVWVCIHHYNATRSFDVRKYVVRNVTGVRADRVCAGVTEDWRSNAALPTIFT